EIAALLVHDEAGITCSDQAVAGSDRCARLGERWSIPRRLDEVRHAQQPTGRDPRAVVETLELRPATEAFLRHVERAQVMRERVFDVERPERGRIEPDHSLDVGERAAGEW